jgi:tungstate transport system permease protein
LFFDGDQTLVGIIALTARVSGSALLLASLLGLPFGAILGLGSFRGKRLVETLVYTGMGLPPVVVGLAIFLLVSNRGPMGHLEWLFTPIGMVLAQTILAFPLVAGLTATAVQEVPETLKLQIRSMGASLWQERVSVIREARTGVLASILAAFGRIISEVGAAMLVGGNIAGRTRVLSTAIVLETRQGNFSLALALGFFLLGIALLANVLMLRLGRRWLG